MSLIGSTRVVLLIAITLAGSEAAGQYAKPDLLAEPAAVLKEPGTKNLRILDARAGGKYQLGHIPGSVWVDAAAWAKAFDSGKDPASWSRRVGQLGIDAGTRVIVYGDNLPDAARIWWILRYWGIANVQLLNGGWQGWQAAGGKATKEEPRPVAREPKLAPQPDRLATKEQVLTMLQGKKGQIIDTRSRAEYCGDDSRARRAGAIPGAIHLEWVDLLDAKTQRFKAPPDLAKTLNAAGIQLGQPLVSYCQSGGRAAVMAFALELMGGQQVRDYYRSWAEWGNGDDTPIVKPK